MSSSALSNMLIKCLNHSACGMSYGLIECARK
jgi:hypothetical protein